MLAACYMAHSRNPYWERYCSCKVVYGPFKGHLHQRVGDSERRPREGQRCAQDDGLRHLQPPARVLSFDGTPLYLCQVFQ